jgi:hypothetical protein
VPASLSPESRIDLGLRQLDCSARNFVAIAKMLGSSISDTGLSWAMTDKKPLDREIGEKLLEILDRMRELQQSIYSATDASGNKIGFVAVNWSKSERIADALTARQLAMIARDQGLDPDKQFQVLADNATKQTI